MRKILLACAASCFGFGAAAEVVLPLRASANSTEQFNFAFKRMQTMSKSQKDALIAAANTPAAVTNFLAGTTAASHADIMGPQFEYLAPSGESQLWYPGNAKTVPGIWKANTQGRKTLVCFKYPAGRYGHETAIRGGDRECEQAIAYLLTVVEVIPGDIFGLSSGKVPYVLNKSAISSAAALKKAGMAPARKNKMGW